MDSRKVIAVPLAFALAGPYLGAALTNPSGPLPEAPTKVAFMALQAPSSTAVLDTVLGREISIARAVDEYPRRAFIAPGLLSITLA